MSSATANYNNPNLRGDRIETCGMRGDRMNLN